jgi:hypothetical protein
MDAPSHCWDPSTKAQAYTAYLKLSKTMWQIQPQVGARRLVKIMCPTLDTTTSRQPEITTHNIYLLCCSMKESRKQDRGTLLCQHGVRRCSTQGEVQPCYLRIREGNNVPKVWGRNSECNCFIPDISSKEGLKPNGYKWRAPPQATRTTTIARDFATAMPARGATRMFRPSWAQVRRKAHLQKAALNIKLKYKRKTCCRITRA